MKKLILFFVFLHISVGWAQNPGMFRYGPIPTDTSAASFWHHSGLPVTDTLKQVRKGIGTLANPDTVGGVKSFNGPLLSASYADIAGNGFFSGRIKSAGITQKIDSIATNGAAYTLTTGQFLLLVNATDTPGIVEVPNDCDDGTLFIIKRIAGENNITVRSVSSRMKIENANTATINSIAPLRIVKYGTKWWIF